MTPLPAGLPNTPQPMTGTQQFNEPAANVASWTLAAPGIPNGMYPLSITGLPAGITVPARVQVFNNEVYLRLTGVAVVPAGTYTLSLVLYDNNGNAITVPTVLTLTTTGAVQGLPHLQTRELRLVVGSTVHTANGQVRHSEAAPFTDQTTNRLMVPLRIVAEGLGAQVTWVGETSTVHINNNVSQFTLTIGVPLPGDMGTPVIVGGHTFVPIRYVAEMLGATVLWDEVNSAVYIRQ